jgi:PAS domain S-box-containing protein
MSATFEKLMNGVDGGLALLQVLAENSFDSVLITDASAEGKIIYANKSFTKLTGHDPSEIIGKTPRILQGPGTDSKVIGRAENLKARRSTTRKMAHPSSCTGVCCRSKWARK